MLTHLSIKNIALISSLELDFYEGLNILSGETGAGKSIIIDALSFVLGKRADRTLIRFGEESATVSACFVFDHTSDIISCLNDIGVDIEENEVILKRTMTVDGKNSCWINGNKVTLSMLRDATQTLVDIYGQHDGASLLNEKNHLSILDNYAKKYLEKYLVAHKKAYDEYKKICADIKKYGSLQEIYHTIDKLEYEIEELTQADLKVGEEDELVLKRNRLNNSQSILQSLNLSYEMIEGDDNDNCLSRIAIAIKELGKISDYDNNIELLFDRLDSIKIELKDMASELVSIAENNEFDQEEYNYCESRLGVIRRLKKKYNNTEEKIIEYLEEIKEKYNFLKDGEDKVAQLEEDKANSEKQLFGTAIELSKARKSQAQLLQKTIESQLNELGMKNSLFVVEFDDIQVYESKANEITDIGCDNIKFLFSANAGQPPRDLSKIISGGELSRFMLALKNVIADSDNITCMIFDEIDSGISGVIAQVVAEKLYALSNSRQVLAITHLPQIASFADYNYLITKFVKDNNTYTQLNLIGGDELILEIARLIGGSQTQLGLSHAQEMIKNNVDKKNKIKMLS